MKLLRLKLKVSSKSELINRVFCFCQLQRLKSLNTSSQASISFEMGSISANEKLPGAVQNSVNFCHPLQKSPSKIHQFGIKRVQFTYLNVTMVQKYTLKKSIPPNARRWRSGQRAHCIIKSNHVSTQFFFLSIRLIA